MKFLTSYLTLSHLRTGLKLGAWVTAFVALGLAGCGGDGSSTPTNLAATTAVQVNMGDAPADWLLSFSMNVSSMTMKTSDGQTVTVAGSSTPLEMIHRLGTMEPVALVSAPRGTYTSAQLNIASCTFSYLDPNTGALQQRTINGPIQASVPFSSSVSVGSTPLAVNFDLDLLHSLSGDTGSAFQFSPKFHISTGSLSSSGSGNGMNARNGGMYQLMGVVTGTAPGGFSIKALQSTNMFNFKVTTETRFQGRISQMSQLGNGMGVLVTAVLQPDGTYLAKQVRATMSSAGAMGGGIITAVDAVPATQLTIVMQNGAGASINTDYLSKTLLVKLLDTTTYEIDTDRVSLTGLDFVPAFDASNIFVGQGILPLSDAAIVPIASCDPACGELTASTVRLREQGSRGTATVDIAPGATTTFVLTLPTDCAFTKLTTATEITVYQQASTNVEDQTTIAAGTTLRVHGLLFYSGGKWRLVASTISSTT
jgi:hypothetical protein